ncbi:ROK family protein [Enterococcus saccharolyticus]|uniref:ROK family protein n=1 Tax=Enterococcus saccharolyticus subsp. saccharolyticus ATCC 43076 TaxID=1139996 RepID=S0JAR6_9ENTE|nr:ROK family protein [Enterococcus saccharolyticus]EOT29387.1 hypothetical protein OMQ_01339 [Enterococcus saccharolyticus subsp. saccharolyticus ATCC 43076]EOT81185.1 hypothetical protein I572_01717 [Enterococcus saccharolyticus subsp. saccharolyticus ATCC 43076]OJG88489.1 hypothetical protein RV16_GL000231 [Enterococcus saccharolyticus]
MSKNKNLIRDKNLAVLKSFLFTKGTALKAEMAKETGISVVTINTLVKELVEKKIILEGDLVQPPLGRPAICYHFNYDQQHFLLLSIQEKKAAIHRTLEIVGKIVNLAGEIKYEKNIDFTEISLDFFLDTLNHFVQLDIAFTKIGLSFPGKIYHGVVLSSWESLFDQWEFEKAWAKQSTIPLLIQNDTHLLTVGTSIQQKLSKTETIVGIFYPENSMPGITIYANGSLIEGGHNLAGEAKFLPHLIDSPTPETPKELTTNLLEILAIYNAVIAPDRFVISADSVTETTIQQAVEQSVILDKQINQPQLLFVDDFQTALTYGLRWLVTTDSIYQL